MASISREVLLKAMEPSRFNPVGLQATVINFVKTIEGGQYDVVDPTNPWVHLVEANCTVGASIMSDANVNNRKQYQISAQTMEDITPHMSDRDHVDMFTLPSQATFIIGFDEEELISRMVYMPGDEIRKVVIPRNTYVTVGETVFSMQYPIEIRQMRHEGLQVVYDVQKTTPLLTITDNYIKPGFQTDASGRRFIYFAVPLRQFDIISKPDVISMSQLTRVGVDISDEYYYTRVWLQRADGSWYEIDTTYTDRIYPSNKVTAIVKVINKTVYVELPIYYVQTGAVPSGSKIRVDVYQTKGPISLDLNGYPKDTYSITWDAVDPREKNEYVAPLSAMQTLFVHSGDITFGGAKAMSFEQVRERVLMNGSSINNLPITPAQAQETIKRSGFNVVKNVDHITNRTYLATQSLPDPINSELITPAAAALNTLIDSIENLASLRTSYENKDSLTLSPDTIYRIDSGVLKVLNNTELAVLDMMLPEKKAETITTGHYFYSPFHYVLDTKNNQFEARPYYIDNPTITSRSFIAENDTTLMQTSIKEIAIKRVPKGYKLILINRANEAYKALPNNKVSATIGFAADRTGDLAYIRGTVVGNDAEGDRIWEFDIDLSYDIDVINHIDRFEVTNAKMYDNTVIDTRMPLDVDFSVFFTTSDTMPTTWEPSNFESLIGAFLLPIGSVGITRESISFNLGKSMANMWSRASSIVGPEDYARWDINVPDTYKEDTYRKDPVTGAAFKVVNGEIVYDLIAKAGDPKMDANGEPIYLHFKGDIKHDAYGRPIVVYGRAMKRRVDIMLIEAAYYYATNKAAVDYRSTLVRNIVNWVTVDLKNIDTILLENTNIFFSPTQAAGSVDVVYGDGLKKSIDAGQRFEVTLYVRDSVYKDSELRRKLRQNTVRVIGAELKKKTVSISGITTAQKASYQKDVISFDTSSFSDGLTLVTMVDDAARLAIRKRLVYRDDNSFALEEDVDVKFVLHERSDVHLEYNA